MSRGWDEGGVLVALSHTHSFTGALSQRLTHLIIHSRTLTHSLTNTMSHTQSLTYYYKKILTHLLSNFAHTYTHQPITLQIPAYEYTQSHNRTNIHTHTPTSRTRVSMYRWFRCSVNLCLDGFFGGF